MLGGYEVALVVSTKSGLGEGLKRPRLETGGVDSDMDDRNDVVSELSIGPIVRARRV